MSLCAAWSSFKFDKANKPTGLCLLVCFYARVCVCVRFCVGVNAIAFVYVFVFVFCLPVRLAIRSCVSVLFVWARVDCLRAFVCVCVCVCICNSQTYSRYVLSIASPCLCSCFTCLLAFIGIDIVIQGKLELLIQCQLVSGKVQQVDFTWVATSPRAKLKANF